MMPFQYSLRIVGFRDLQILKMNNNTVVPFSIPCESWGSATHYQELSIPTPPHSFQYSLRIVGFRDNLVSANSPMRQTSFSIPCESWGSATQHERAPVAGTVLFQYSLRIVGFRDWLKFQAGREQE